MSELMEHSGVARRSMYQHFPAARRNCWSRPPTRRAGTPRRASRPHCTAGPLWRV
ncbi:hypothetical protein [Gordonia sp. YC-JH1]|uniref:hypothetical protein n=1 Tax=Gordonia sp. YC-JH1 TaxID=2059875 RepID=UPI001F40ADC6|nr:hypothetical protein [Gordonia sp. YC-JH1]